MFSRNTLGESRNGPQLTVCVWGGGGSVGFSVFVVTCMRKVHHLFLLMLGLFTTSCCFFTLLSLFLFLYMDWVLKCTPIYQRVLKSCWFVLLTRRTIETKAMLFCVIYIFFCTSMFFSSDDMQHFCIFVWCEEKDILNKQTTMFFILCPLCLWIYRLWYYNLLTPQFVHEVSS